MSLDSLIILKKSGTPRGDSPADRLDRDILSGVRSFGGEGTGRGEGTDGDSPSLCSGACGICGYDSRCPGWPQYTGE